MKYINKIIQTLFWGLLIVVTATIWCLVQFFSVLWHFNSKHCFSITTYGWLHNFYYETSEEYSKNITYYKSIKDLWLDNVTEEVRGDYIARYTKN